MPASKSRTKAPLTKRQQASIELAKRYQKEAAILKRKGILTSKVNARKEISRATRTKINKFRGVLEGTQIAVPAGRDVRAKYKDADVLPVIGRHVLAPREFENQRAVIKRGMVTITRPLKNGTEEYVILPFKATDLPDLARKLQEDETLDNLKQADELFSFRLFGHNSNDSFVSAAEMGKHLEFYITRLGGNKNNVKHITFQRFKVAGPNDETEFVRNPFTGKEPKVPYNSNIDARGRSKHKYYGSEERKRDQRKAAAKAARRAKETPQEKDARRTRDRLYSARYRQRMFEGS